MERQVGFEFGIVRFFLLDNQEITFLFFLYTLDSTLRWAVLSSESPDGTGGLGLIDRQAHGEFFDASGAASIQGLMSWHLGSLFLDFEILEWTAANHYKFSALQIFTVSLSSIPDFHVFPRQAGCKDPVWDEPVNLASLWDKETATGWYLYRLAALDPTMWPAEKCCDTGADGPWCPGPCVCDQGLVSTFGGRVENKRSSGTHWCDFHTNSNCPAGLEHGTPLHCFTLPPWSVDPMGHAEVKVLVRSCINLSGIQSFMVSKLGAVPGQSHTFFRLVDGLNFRELQRLSQSLEKLGFDRGIETSRFILQYMSLYTILLFLYPCISFYNI